MFALKPWQLVEMNTNALCAARRAGGEAGCFSVFLMDSQSQAMQQGASTQRGVLLFLAGQLILTL